MLFVFLRKFLLVIPTLIGASLIAFALIRLVPGDPVLNLLGERGGNPQVVAEMRAKLGIDKPLAEQYWIFLKNALHGDLGDSIVSNRPVAEEFWSRFPATLELAGVSLVWSILLGLPLGILAALRRNSALDYSVIGVSLIGYSMPIFWWGLILVIVFSVQLGWFPVSGRLSVFFEVPPKTGFLLVDSLLSEEGWSAFVDAVKHLVLPSIVLGTIPLAVMARMTRSSLLEVLGEDYVRTAKAKGLSWFRVVYVHALRNALIPIVTVVGLMVGALLTGAVLTETIFSWPGIGRWLVKSVEARDYPVIQGGVLYLAFLIVMVNLIVDLTYLWIYPRMRSRT
ncbi:MAG: dipeptide ABC transporter permease DppB [Bdellovibrio sp. CG10_big_fil_rev_8_21_14_0_10_47_8]|nr:MAG: dipeptide ABC transporter permease DppB [Bdellovibrio sp. CG10_big_fil_rev_8_21_14_0_10_47_8]